MKMAFDQENYYSTRSTQVSGYELRQQRKKGKGKGKGQRGSVDHGLGVDIQLKGEVAPMASAEAFTKYPKNVENVSFFRSTFEIWNVFLSLHYIFAENYVFQF